MYCKRWEEMTKKVIQSTMEGEEEYLMFTTDSGEEFNDTKLKVEQSNKVLFSYFEKEVGARRTVMKRYSIPEPEKIQVLLNDLVRKFFNTREDIPTKEFWQMTDNYAQRIRKEIKKRYGEQWNLVKEETDRQSYLVEEKRNQFPRN